jgi:hypothetical protein
MTQTVWNIALSLVERHPRGAPYLLHAHIMRLRRRLADETVINSWLLVDHAVHELVRTAPRSAERLH